MKKTFKLLLIINILIVLVGCSKNDKISISNYREEEVDFKLENINLNRSFQNIEEDISASQAGDDIRLFISLGIVDASHINVEKISKKGQEVNIYLEALTEEESNLTVPQVSLYLKDMELTQDLDFKIVRTNYEPIHIKFNKVDIIKKLSTDFNIAPINIPAASLSKKDDRIVWDIDFYSVINKDSPNQELVNLFTIVDADTGKVLESMNDNISNRMFSGQALDYVDKTLLIKEDSYIDHRPISYLYIYNEDLDKKSLVFKTGGKIEDAKINKEANQLAIIESRDQDLNLYTLSLETGLATKLNPQAKIIPKMIKWKEGNRLFILDKDSNIQVYNPDKETGQIFYQGDFPIDDFDIYEEDLILLESSQEINKPIHYRRHGGQLEKIGLGRELAFVDRNNLVFLSNKDLAKGDQLFKYNIESKLESAISNRPIRIFRVQDEENIIYSYKDSKYNSYIVNRYNIIEDVSRPIFHMIDDDIFLNYRGEYVYLNLSHSEDPEDKYVYRVYLDSLAIE